MDSLATIPTIGTGHEVVMVTSEIMKLPSYPLTMCQKATLAALSAIRKGIQVGLAVKNTSGMEKPMQWQPVLGEIVVNRIELQGAHKLGGLSIK